MIEILGLHHVQVAAPPGCEEAARAFYGRLLGLPEIEKPALLAGRGGCWFGLGAGELHIGVETPFRPATKAHPALVVGSLEQLGELAASLTAGGFELRWPAGEEIPGLRRFHMNDPWGNRLELVAVAPAT